MRKLNDWLDSYLDYTSETEPARLFREWVGVSTIAACLQRKCRLKWGRYTFYPNLYIVLVAPSGRGRKGTAMKDGRELLDTLGINIASESVTREALIKTLKACSQNTGILTEDGAPIFHSSITIHSAELTVFLGFGNLQLIMDLTDWYDHSTPTWTYRTKTQGTDEIVGLWVNLIGATTPDLIQSSMSTDAIGGGLTARMIFVYEDDSRKIIFPEPKDSLKQELVEDLSRINALKGDFSPTDEFFNRWANWYPNQAPPFDMLSLAGYLERRHVHVMKTAMIMSASRGSDMKVTGKDFDRALELIERTEVKMPRTFSGVGRSDIASVLSTVMTIVATRGEIDMSELMRIMRNDANIDELERVVRTLEMMKFATLVVSNGQSTIRLTRKEKQQ